MPMTGKLTFTGPLGPGNSVTSLVKSDLRSIEFDFQAQVVKTVDAQGKMQSFDVKASTTLTATITAGVLVAQTLSQ